MSQSTAKQHEAVATLFQLCAAVAVSGIATPHINLNGQTCGISFYCKCANDETVTFERTTIYLNSHLGSQGVDRFGIPEQTLFKEITAFLSALLNQPQRLSA